MKTTMQELIDELEFSFYDHKKGHYISQMIVISTIINKAKNKLEKEKEQIIEAHWAGWNDAYDYLNSDSNDRARQAEEYYEETYL